MTVLPTDPRLDPAFATLPLDALADAALQRARDLGVEHADLRVERIRTQTVRVRDHAVQGVRDGEQVGLAVRVVHDGAWGFAADVVLTPEAAAGLAVRAVEVARVAAAMTTRPVELAPEPVHAGTWVSDYLIDPWHVPVADKTGLLLERTGRLLAADAVQHASAGLLQVHECTFYADLAGTRTLQQRIRLEPTLEATGAHGEVVDSLATLAPPVGRGWEYLVEPGLWDWEGELVAMPELLAEKLRAPGLPAGSYDLVIDPTNLWLTIHESIGHATELDRALGYEASYAGTSFATPDQVGSLRYGSPLMNVTGDRTVPHGLATVGFDHDGVEAQSFDLVRHGLLVGFQLDRSSAALLPEVSGGRSNGCAFADSPAHVPIQRMANVSLQPAPGGPTTEELIADVEDGLYVVGDRSWSIDMQRFNFQFTAQRFHRIRGGELVGQVRDVAYQGTTTDFWGSMDAVGGPETWRLCGAFNCGKAQPGQVAAVSHGTPSARFRGVRVLDTREEGGR